MYFFHLKCNARCCIAEVTWEIWASWKDIWRFCRLSINQYLVNSCRIYDLPVIFGDLLKFCYLLCNWSSHVGLIPQLLSGSELFAVVSMFWIRDVRNSPPQGKGWLAGTQKRRGEFGLIWHVSRYNRREIDLLCICAPLGVVFSIIRPQLQAGITQVQQWLLFGF